MCAVALYHQVYMGFIPWTEQTINAIYVHAKIAIEREDADEYSHWAMECAHLLRKEHELAAGSLRRALEINSNCSLAYGSMGTVLAWGGHCDASVESNQLALRLNPQDPSNFFRHFGLALAHYLAARYDKAVAHARMVVQARPTWWLAEIVYVASLAQSGRVKEAAHALADLLSARPEIKRSSLVVLPFASPGDREHLELGLRKAGFGDVSPAN
jgi:tetratricopeptide (TPR) repeat protein